MPRYYRICCDPLLLLQVRMQRHTVEFGTSTKVLAKRMRKVHRTSKLMLLFNTTVSMSQSHAM